MVRLSWWLTMFGYSGLIIVLVSWYGWLLPPVVLPRSIVLALLLVPLLFPLRGLLHGRPYTFAWTSFLALIYFIHGVSEAWAVPEARILGMLEIIFSLCLYSGAMLFARYRSKQLKDAADPEQKES